MKHLVIGNFGFRKKQLDGQTVKTRVFSSALSKVANQTNIFDVGGVSPIISMLKLILSIPLYDRVYFLPGKKQLYFISPILIFYKMIFSRKIHYIVVGGWINNLARSSFYIRYILGKFNSVSAELPSMVDTLKSYNRNSRVLTNFRLESPITYNEKKYEESCNDCKLVYFSRVMREKGIFEAIDAVEMINKRGIKNISLSIFGPLAFLSDEDEKIFHKKVSIIDSIEYNGALRPENIYKSLSNFDFLIFPTKYEGEGLPGCIVDAKFSGIAVICTSWKYNLEVINHNEDGVAFNNSSFVDDTCDFIENMSKETVSLMKLKSAASSKYYSENAFLTWFHRL